MIHKKLMVLLSLLTFSVHEGWAVQHVIPGTYPHAVQDKIHHPSAARVRAAGSALAATISSATGSKKVAVIIVQFPSGNAALRSGGATSNHIQSLSAINTYFTQMGSYYDEVSYHKIALTFKYFGPSTGSVDGDADAATAGAYTFDGTGGTPNHPMEYYGCGDESEGCLSVTVPTQGANGNYLIRDAIIVASTGHAGLKSVDAGGTYDAVIVVHAGNGNETTPCNGSPRTNGDIWSIFYSDDAAVIGGQSPVSAPAAVAGFSEGDVVPETEAACNGVTSPLGVMCHEFGHSLGLPDLYNTSGVGGSSVVGRWEIMDSGPYDGPALHGGENPAHMGAWDKMTLGWVSPTVASTRLNTTLTYAETTPASLLRIPVQNGLAQEYFLVEYRSATSGAQYDRYIPGSGLLIWHVDDAIATGRGINASGANSQNSVNTGIPHYGVSIVAADGSFVGQFGGAASNVFSNQSVFTTPKSDNFSGQPSGVSVVNISGVGTGTVALQVASLSVTQGQTISKVINYPNPAGKGYPHPSGEGHTTIQMQLTRPASDYQINIYTLSGDLVRKVRQEDIILTVDRSLDQKWVYEYVWDLTNGDGKKVSPGVYLYLVRADGKSQSGKAVVIR